MNLLGELLDLTHPLPSVSVVDASFSSPLLPRVQNNSRHLPTVAASVSTNPIPNIHRSLGTLGTKKMGEHCATQAPPSSPTKKYHLTIDRTQ